MKSIHRRSACWFAFVALAAGCSSAPSPETAEATAPIAATKSAAPAAKDTREIEEWRKVMARTPHPSDGCFQASHPATTWQAVPCLKTPGIPYTPRKTRDGLDVGASSGDVSPQVSGTTITWAEGSFPQVTGVTSTSSYSLQVNTNTLPYAPLCSGASDPSACSGWEQFVYASVTEGGPDMVFIQYWLLDYNNSCPSGWNQFGSDCFTDSAGAAAVPNQPLSNLGNITLTGTAGSSDTATMSVSGTLYSVSQASVHNLSAQWTTAEFNVFGNGGGSQVSFNAGSTIVAKTVTSSASGTRAQPAAYPHSFTGETNNLNVVPNSTCTFGGDTPGVQFMESNVSGVTPPVCPKLVSSANPVAVPEGGSWSTNLEISGNLVGQTSNTALLPSTCSATGPVASTPSPAVLWQGIGPEIEYSIPAGTAVGTSYTEVVSCDNGQGLNQAINVASPLLSANPGTITVLTNSCSTDAYAGASLVWANTGDGYCDTITYTANAPAGLEAFTQNAYVDVCDSAGTPRSVDMTVSSNSCVGEPSTALVHVNVVSCIPLTSCGSSCQAAMPDNCGGTLDCSSNCSGGETCTAPQGETAGLMCCEPGQYIPAGGTSCVCENGGTWNATLGECVPPPPHCTAPGTSYCAATGTCLSPVACKNASGGGGCTPAQVKAHTCS